MVHRSGNTAQRLTVVAIALVATVAFAVRDAAAQGWLAGASGGTTKQYDYEVGGPVENRDESGTGYRAFGGYLFHPNFGVVLSYVDLGEATYSGSAFGGFTDVLDADGFDVSFLAGFAPGSQERFTLFATAGAFRWQQDVRYEDDSGVYAYDDKGTSVSFGVGAEVSLGKGARWGIHLGWQRFMDVGDASNSGHEYDRDFVSAGFDYRFGR